VSYRICCGLAGGSLRVYFLMARDGDADAFFYGVFWDDDSGVVEHGLVIFSIVL